jgi:hypothetical protein
VTSNDLGGVAEGAWQEFQQIPDWRPGTVGMGW